MNCGRAEGNNWFEVLHPKEAITSPSSLKWKFTPLLFQHCQQAQHCCFSPTLPQQSSIYFPSNTFAATFHKLHMSVLQMLLSASILILAKKFYATNFILLVT